ncbi:MAG: DUF2384 domain-containing protein [Massilia sp.]|nr:MAG: DUF2384 domain-containing protein [Massilia sp.]
MLEDLLTLTRSIFQTTKDADSWLRSPHPMLGGATPLDAAATPEGAERVRALLIAIQHSFPV